MNNTYRLVWNNTLQAWVVASELAKSHKKSKAVKLAVALVTAALGGAAWAVPAVDALPTGEVIPGGGGSATFDRSVTNQLTVNQSSSKLITNWTGFNIGSNAKVIFNQPDANSIALNRISGGTTEIFGQLNSNGQVFLVNPAGFTFGSTAQVSVGALVASVFSISDANFNAGNYKFSRIGTNANVDNFGSITTTAGDVTFLAPFSYNYGSIVANGGNVNVVNAQDVNLSNTLAPTINSASNTIGLIRSLGSIQANTVSSVGGRILLRGDTSTASSSISVAGRLQADDSISANGKTINLSNNLQLNGNTSVTAADNINVHAVTDVASNKALTLTHGSDAGEGFYLSSGAKLNLNGASAAFTLNGQSYTVVHDINQLQAIGADAGSRAGRYVLAGDIDATATSSWNNGTGFAPIGTSGFDDEQFSGKLDGLGHTVKSLYINRPSQNLVGLFGVVNGGSIQNIGLLNPQITGADYVGALAGIVQAGFVQSALIHNTFVQGGSINGNWRVAGLLGQLYTIGATASLSQSYAEGTTVNGGGEIAGGLVADLTAANAGTASIGNSFSTGVVNGGNSSGGLVGFNSNNSGGNTLISNSYSTSKIVSAGIQGALVGQIYAGGGNITVDSSYASGQVTGAAAGGLIGMQTQGGGSSTISNSYWDSDTTGQGNAVGINNSGILSNVLAVSGNGGSNPSAFDQNSYANLNFGSNWFTVSGQTRPMLRAFLSGSGSGHNSINIPVNTLYQLQAITLNTGNIYKYNLTQNIYASATQDSVAAGNAGNFSDVWGGKGFSPLASVGTKMQAGLDGGSHIISRLGIDRPDMTGVGLISGSVVNTIKNIGLQDVSIVGGQYTGALIGYSIQVAVDNSFATGQVTGSNVYAGGLIGLNDGVSIISNSYADVDTYGDYYVGGLLGYNSGTVLNSYASGLVSASQTITGGLIAYNGGGSVVNSYWDTTSTGQSGSDGGGTGVTTSQLESLSTFSGWDIDAQAGTGTTWRIYDGYGGPLLRSFLTPLTVTAGETKTYDGSNYAGGVTPSDATANLANILGGNYTGAAIGARNAGTYGINVTGLYSNQQGYDLTVNGSGSLVITPMQLVIGSTDVSKTYDGTTTANGSAVAVSATQLFDTDSLSGGSFAFTDKNAGTGKTVTVSGVTVNDGNGGNNYTVSYANNTGSTINKASLLISSVDVNRVYDGTTAAAGTAITHDTLYDTDTISGGNFAFDNKHAGTGKHVIVSNVTVNDGNGGGNYNVSYADNTNSSISKAGLVITNTGASKFYDGTTVANSTAVVGSGTLYGSDSISGGDFAYDNKNADINKHVAVSNVTVNDGNGGNNYTVSYTDNTSGSISRALLWLTTGDVSKVYDGSTSAAGTAMSTSGTQLFGSDSLSGGTFTYDNRNAGTGKTVSVSAVTVADGNNGNNYLVGYVNNTNSSISKASLVVSTAAVNKTYDGTTSAAGTATAVSGTQLFGSDSLSGGSFLFDNRNTGANKTITVSAATVNDGNSGNNYDVSYANSTGSISKADLHIAAAQVTKTYDGTTSASGTAQANSILFGTDNISGGTLSFDNRHAGTGKTVSVSGVTVNDGNSGNNYNVIYDANHSSTITPASLVISSSNISKTYDGSTSAATHAVLANSTHLFGSDSISGGTFTFDNRNVGTGKTVNVSGVTINDGNNGNNYSVTYVANSASSISKALLLLQANSLSRVYDGTTNANTSIHIASGQLFGSDSYTGGAFQFADKNVGNNKQLVLTQNVSLNDGNNGGNYLVAFVPSTTSSITPATLNIQAVADSKVYDGKINSSARPDVNGLFGSDRVTGLWQQFANDNAGTGKTINIKSGFVVDDGNGGANYTVNTLNTNSGIITPASLTLSAVTDSKVFEGNLNSTGKPLVSGLVQGDRVTGLFQQFADRNAGTDKTINIKNGYVVDDGNGGNNYTVTLVSDHSGVITPKQLLINAVAGSKVYDGGITSAGKPVVSGLAHGDRVTGLFQLYENKQVGTGKRLYIKSGYMVRDGNNGGNYDVVITENNAGVITAH